MDVGDCGTSSIASSGRGSTTGSTVWHLVGIVLLVGLVLVCYGGMLQGQEFVWDDHEYVTGCEWLEDLSLPNLREHAFEPWMGNYHPLTMLSLAIDQQRSGGDPSAFKMTNLILHAMNAVLVYLVVWMLLRLRSVALIGALLFVVHPTRVESVAWISERKDLLFTGFYLVGLLAYAGLRRQGWRLTLALVAFILAAASKPMAISFPLVLLIIDVGQGRLTKRLLLEKIPFFVVAVLLGLATLDAQQQGIHDTPSWIDRGLLSFQALGLYLEKLVWPQPLAVLYRRPSDVVLDPETLLGMALVGSAVIAWGLGRHRGRKTDRVAAGRLSALCLTAFLVMTLPVLHVVTFGEQLAADRYTYLAYVPLFVLVGAGLVRLGTRRRVIGATVAVGLAAAVVGSSSLTVARVKSWKNDRTLFSSLLAFDPTSPLAHTWLGVEAKRSGDLDAAERHFRAALETAPDDPNALLDLAILDRDRGRLEPARLALERVVTRQPDWNHAWVYLGQIDDRLGRFDESRRAFERAIEADPNAAIAWIGLATHAVRDRDLTRALDLVERALEIRPRAWRAVERSPRLAPLRRTPECARLVAEAKQRDETLRKR